MSHLIANTLTQIRNSAAVGKRQCRVVWSGFNERFLLALQEAGYIAKVEKIDDRGRAELEISLIPGRIQRLDLVSKPGRRSYVGYRQMPVIMNGLGTVIISTPKGIMTGENAKAQKLGGEVICQVA